MKCSLYILGGLTLLSLSAVTNARSVKKHQQGDQLIHDANRDGLKEAIDFILEQANLPKLPNGKRINMADLKFENVIEILQQYLSSRRVHEKISDLAKKASVFYRTLKTKLKEQEVRQNEAV